MPFDSAREIKAATFREAAELVAGLTNQTAIVKMLEEKAVQINPNNEPFHEDDDFSRRGVDIANRMVEEAIQQRVLAGNKAAVAALQQLLCWVPGFYKEWPLIYGDHYNEDQAKEERERCHNAPMFTEAWSYELFGKDQARTLLSLAHQIAKALGTDMHSLMDDETKFHGETYVSEADRKEQERRDKWKDERAATGEFWDSLALAPARRQNFYDDAAKWHLEQCPGDAKYKANYRYKIAPTLAWKKLTGVERARLTHYRNELGDMAQGL